MTLPIAFHAEARPDILAAFDWYEEKRIGLGDDFLESLESTLGRISAFPEGPAVVHREIRVRQVDRFPFGVYYRLEEERILVLAVVHFKRRASVWKSRSE